MAKQLVYISPKVRVVNGTGSYYQELISGKFDYKNPFAMGMHFENRPAGLGQVVNQRTFGIPTFIKDGKPLGGHPVSNELFYSVAIKGEIHYYHWSEVKIRERPIKRQVWFVPENLSAESKVIAHLKEDDYDDVTIKNFISLRTTGSKLQADSIRGRFIYTASSQIYHRSEVSFGQESTFMKWFRDKPIGEIKGTAVTADDPGVRDVIESPPPPPIVNSALSRLASS